VVEFSLFQNMLCKLLTHSIIMHEYVIRSVVVCFVLGMCFVCCISRYFVNVMYCILTGSTPCILGSVEYICLSIHLSTYPLDCSCNTEFVLMNVCEVYSFLFV
jgi:hypothetical protein